MWREVWRETPEVKTQVLGARHRWECNIKMCFKEMGWNAFD
jgi:hypothetical protein